MSTYGAVRWECFREHALVHAAVADTLKDCGDGAKEAGKAREEGQHHADTGLHLVDR